MTDETRLKYREAIERGDVAAATARQRAAERLVTVLEVRSPDAAEVAALAAALGTLDGVCARRGG